MRPKQQTTRRGENAARHRRIGLGAVLVLTSIAAYAGLGRIQRPVAAEVTGPLAVGAVAPRVPGQLGARERGSRPALVLLCCGCGLCRQTVRALGQAFPAGSEVLRIGVYHGTTAQTEQFRRDNPAPFAWAPDPLGQIHAAWRVDQCPSLFAVSPAGLIARVEQPHNAAEIARALARARQALTSQGGD